MGSCISGLGGGGNAIHDSWYLVKGDEDDTELNGFFFKFFYSLRLGINIY